MSDSKKETSPRKVVTKKKEETPKTVGELKKEFVAARKANPEKAPELRAQFLKKTKALKK